jgi:hypothetical protein
VKQYEVARVNLQGADEVIVFVEPEFGRRPAAGREGFVAAPQVCATFAGLAGNVVPVWGDFRDMTHEQLHRKVNTNLACG